MKNERFVELGKIYRLTHLEEYRVLDDIFREKIMDFKSRAMRLADPVEREAARISANALEDLLTEISTDLEAYQEEAERRSKGVEDGKDGAPPQTPPAPDEGLDDQFN